METCPTSLGGFSASTGTDCAALSSTRMAPAELRFTADRPALTVHPRAGELIFPSGLTSSLTRYQRPGAPCWPRWTRISSTAVGFRGQPPSSPDYASRSYSRASSGVWRRQHAHRWPRRDRFPAARITRPHVQSLAPPHTASDHAESVDDTACVLPPRRPWWSRIKIPGSKIVVGSSRDGEVVEVSLEGEGEGYGECLDIWSAESDAH